MKLGIQRLGCAEAEKGNKPEEGCTLDQSMCSVVEVWRHFRRALQTMSVSGGLQALCKPLHHRPHLQLYLMFIHRDTF